MAKRKKPDTPGKQVVEQADVEGRVLLRWSVSPFQRESRKARIFTVSTLGFLVLLFALYRDILWVVFATVLIVGTFNSFLFPSHYRLTTTGVGIKTGLNQTFKKWGDYEKVKKFPDGVYLGLNVGKKGRHGHFLYFGDSNAEDILATIEKYMSSRDSSANK